MAKLVQEIVQRAVKDITRASEPFLRADAVVPPDVAQKALQSEYDLSKIIQSQSVMDRLMKIGEAVLSFNARDMERVLDVVAPAVNRGLVSAWASENLLLIRNMAKQEISKIQESVVEAFNTGARHEQLAKTLARRGEVLGNRARLIAKNEILSLNSKVTTSRHKLLGLNRFVWVTSRDERVREEHEALDGQTFSYNNPPAEGLPGEPINCRCTAVPLLPGE